MITRKSTFFIGIIIFLLPFIGVPSLWKTFFLVFIGVMLSLSSIQIVFVKKDHKTKVKKHRIQEPQFESIAVYPKDNIIDGNRNEELTKSEPVVVKVVKKRVVRKVKSLE